MIETWWGSRETARATAKPQIEFSRLGDNPHSYLKTYLSLKKKKSLSSETFLVPVATSGITFLGLGEQDHSAFLSFMSQGMMSLSSLSSEIR